MRIRISEFWPLLWFIAISIFVSGCSQVDELDRAKAKEIIVGASKEPIETVATLRLAAPIMGSSEVGYYKKYIAALNQTGLGVGNVERRSNNQYRYDFTLNNEGKALVRKVDENEYLTDASVVTFKGTFGEVTGINFLNAEKTIAKVEYTIVYAPTPFASLMSLDEVPITLPNNATPTATLTLYDDGWRMEK